MPTYNWAGLLTTDNYATAFVPKSNDANVALAQWLDPAYVTHSGTPATGAKRLASGGVVQQWNGTTWVDLPTGYAKNASPVFTGAPTAPTAGADTNTTQLATTAFVLGQAGSAAPLINGTAAVGASWRYARQDHVHPIDSTRAALASPTFTGAPTAPTAAPGTNTTQLATTAFVQAGLAQKLSLSGGSLSGPLWTGNPEMMRGNADGALVCGYNTAGSVRTGYLQFVAGGAVLLAAEGASRVDVVVGSTTRLAIGGGGTVSTGAARTAVITQAYAAALSFDARASNVFLIGTLTGNVTSIQINNPVEGQFITLRFMQDGTGGRTIALPASSAVTGSPNTAAGKVSYLNITWNGAIGRFEGAWLAVP